MLIECRGPEEALDAIGGLLDLNRVRVRPLARVVRRPVPSPCHPPPKLHTTFTLPARVIHEGSFLLGSPGRY